MAPWESPGSGSVRDGRPLGVTANAKASEAVESGLVDKPRMVPVIAVLGLELPIPQVGIFMGQ